MDPVYLFWLFATGTLVGGGIIGAIIYRNLTPGKKKTDDLKAELDAARLEMETYKTSVNSHFDKTAELVNELTQDYVKVYKHLAEGAQALGEGRDFANVLEQHQGKVLISVDSDKNVQETIVSEVSVDAQEIHETPTESSDSLDQEIDQESIAAGSEDVGAREEISDSAEPSAESGEKKEPVINVDKLALNPDADKTEAKPVKSNGSGALEENLTAKSDPQKESAPTPSA
jgi:uncharacterized membrane-anchored protein YhcB (DUF1043 family)